MKKLFLLPLITLSACGGNQQVPTADVTGCVMALAVSATGLNPAAIAIAALSTPACQNLAQDVIQQVVVPKVITEKHKRGLTR